MIVGLPKEIKPQEYRVAMTPATVHELCSHHHEVWVESTAGMGSGFSDQAYEEAGAKIVQGPEEIFSGAELILKVKEPLAAERARLEPNHTLFTYLHLAPDLDQTEELIASGARCIAYETVTDDHGHLPLLTPMSEVAGRMSIQAGAHCMEKSAGGQGILLGGVPGVPPATVTILGGGVVGANAATMAVGLGARVIILDKNPAVLRELDARFGSKITTVFSTRTTVAEWVTQADLVVGAILIPGASSPKLINRELLRQMKDGAALVDVAIDQGGCCETSRPTTHHEPTYIEEGVVHYCVANMPGALARTATQALNNATLPFILELADKGTTRALSENKHLRQGLNVALNQLTCPHVGESQQRAAITPEEAIRQM